ncbi:MAG TPA: hypothetical protein VLS87_05805, partial [Woeseiaceae bacterium]|nr:hypothetical protein [Woeseiaceae bacterium]
MIRPAGRRRVANHRDESRWGSAVAANIDSIQGGGMTHGLPAVTVGVTGRIPEGQDGDWIIEEARHVRWPRLRR